MEAIRNVGAGVVSGIAGVLVAPITVVNIGTFSFLLVKAMGAALIADEVGYESPSALARALAASVARSLGGCAVSSENTSRRAAAARASPVGAARTAVGASAAARTRDHWDRRSTAQSSAESAIPADELGFVTGP